MHRGIRVEDSVGIELVREHLDPACIVGVREVKPQDLDTCTKKRKYTERHITLSAGVCLLHHTEKACTQAMAEPARAFLFGVLCKRVKQKKKALTGRLGYSLKWVFWVKNQFLKTKVFSKFLTQKAPFS